MRRQSNRKINVLIVAAGLGIGGAEVVIQRLAKMLDRRRFEVTICCIKALGTIGEQLADEGYEIICLSDPKASRVDYLTFGKLLKVARQRNIDVLHTHTIDALADAAVCKVLLPRLKLLHTFHFGNYPHVTRRRMWMERIFSNAADCLVAVGLVQRQQLQSLYRFSDRRVRCVWNGVSINDASGGDAFRARIDAGSRTVIGTIATLTEQKGLRDFLAVASRFRDQADKVIFVIVGEGHLRAELEAIRDDLHLGGIVVFSGWVPNAAEVALPAFDIFFQPSLWEAMSVAILEAMAAAKPVVATAVGDNPHIISNGIDGLLVEPSDIDGMAVALRRFIDDSELRISLGGSARQKVTRQFTVQQMAQTYERIYKELVPGKSQ